MVASTELRQGKTISSGCRLQETKDTFVERMQTKKVQEKMSKTYSKQDGAEKNTRLSSLRYAVSGKHRTDSKSGVTGVNFDKQTNKWRASITVKKSSYIWEDIILKKKLYKQGNKPKKSL